MDKDDISKETEGTNESDNNKNKEERPNSANIEDKYIRMELFALGEVSEPEGALIILLKESEGTRGFPIMVHPAMAQYTKYCFSKGVIPRDRRHEMMDVLLNHFFTNVVEVKINNECLRKDIALVAIEVGYHFDAEPEILVMPLHESVIFALRRNIPLLVQEKLLNRFKTRLRFEGKTAVVNSRSMPVENNDKTSDLKVRKLFRETYGTMADAISAKDLKDLNIIDTFSEKIKTREPEEVELSQLLEKAEDDVLKVALDRMVVEENYEWASIIHNEIEHRKQNEGEEGTREDTI